MTKKTYFLDSTQDISVEISGEKGQYYLSIYNDKTNKSLALNVSASKLLDFADFINKFVEKHQ